MEQMIRYETDIEKDYNRKHLRNPYGGSCDWCRNNEEEIYPWNDTFCMRCTARMAQSDDTIKQRVAKARQTERRGLCRGCGEESTRLSTYVPIQLFLCKTCMKLIRRYDMYRNTADIRDANEQHARAYSQSKAEALGL